MIAACRLAKKCNRISCIPITSFSGFTVENINIRVQYKKYAKESDTKKTEKVLDKERDSLVLCAIIEDDGKQHKRKRE